MLELLKGLLALGAPATAGAKRCLVVDADGNVVNTVMVDPALPDDQQWPPPEGHTIVPDEDGDIGWRYEAGALIDPRPPVPGRLPEIAPVPTEEGGMTIV